MAGAVVAGAVVAGAAVAGAAVDTATGDMAMLAAHVAMPVARVVMPEVA